MKLRDLVAGGLLAAFLVACSAASPTAPNTGNPQIDATAAAGADAANTAVPGLSETSVAGVDAAVTAAPAVQATAESATGMGADDLMAMVGESVTISGPVGQIISPMLFEINDADLGGDQGVLVIAPAGSMSIGQGQQVEVTGMVQEFNLSELERTLGVEIDDATAAGLDGRAIVVAQVVIPGS